MLPRDVIEDMGKYIFGIMLQITYGIGHFTMNHEKVLEKGLRSIIQEAVEKYDRLDTADKDKDKGIFYKSVIRSLEAAVLFANRYADLAEKMAIKETNGNRKKSLRKSPGSAGGFPNIRHPAFTKRFSRFISYTLSLKSNPVGTPSLWGESTGLFIRITRRTWKKAPSGRTPQRNCCPFYF